MKHGNNELLTQIRDLLTESAVNQARMLAIIEEVTKIQSSAVPGEGGLEIRLRQRPAQPPRIIRPVWR